MHQNGTKRNWKNICFGIKTGNKHLKLIFLMNSNFTK